MGYIHCLVNFRLVLNMCIKDVLVCVCTFMSLCVCVCRCIIIRVCLIFTFYQQITLMKRCASLCMWTLFGCVCICVS